MVSPLQQAERCGLHCIATVITRSRSRRPALMIPRWGKGPHSQTVSAVRSRGRGDDKGWTTAYPRAGNTGILTGSIVGVDVDVPDAKWPPQSAIRNLHAGRLTAEALRGQAEVPAGVPNGRALREDVDGQISVSAAGTKHQVEILGKGQQFVALGVHPRTGNEYTWGHSPVSPPLTSHSSRRTGAPSSFDRSRRCSGRQASRRLVTGRAWSGRVRLRRRSRATALFPGRWLKICSPSFRTTTSPMIPGCTSPSPSTMRSARKGGRCSESGLPSRRRTSRRRRKSVGVLQAGRRSHHRHAAVPRERERMAGPTSSGPAVHRRPAIHVVEGQLHHLVDQAEVALCAAGLDVYQRGGQIVRPMVVPVSIDKGREVMSLNWPSHEPEPRRAPDASRAVPKVRGKGGGDRLPAKSGRDFPRPHEAVPAEAPARSHRPTDTSI